MLIILLHSLITSSSIAGEAITLSTDFYLHGKIAPVMNSLTKSYRGYDSASADAMEISMRGADYSEARE